MASHGQKLLLRIQSSEGTKRVEVSENTTIDALLRIVAETFNLAPDATTWRLFQDRSKTTQLFSSARTVKQSGLKHGDLLYLDILAGGRMDVDDTKSPLEMARRRTNSSFGSAVSLPGVERDSSATPLNSSMMSESGRYYTESAPAQSDVAEDEVDQSLWTQDGSIQRPKDERLCKHGPSGKCLYCIPIEPFDESYLQSREPPIKHMSFHSYIRKLTSGANKGKFAALNETSCRIKPGCTTHLPWPEGICTKCQPSAVTLNRQRYRHVDNISFENADLVERFLDHYRRTGLQRIGFLYGKYEQHKDVPLGIRATVAAIYEPPQVDSENGVMLQEDTHAEVVDCVAMKLGLRRVGWIFTDLLAEDVRKGTVKYLRNKDTYFLTAEECITAAFFQSQHPNPCKLSKSGQFGSKFVTVVVTGDKDSQIHFEGYQVSNQCMSLVRDSCLVPTYDAPDLAYVRESSTAQYVPDVFYKEKDKYGNEVTSVARPLPVEYAIVDVPASMPKEPHYTFRSTQVTKGKQAFPVENRLDQNQDIMTLIKYVSQFSKAQLVDAMSDFHLLVFMATLESVTLQDEDLDILVAAIQERSSEILDAWMTNSTFWTTVKTMAGSESGKRSSVDQGPSTSWRATNGHQSDSSEVDSNEWNCPHCTFVNTGPRDACEVCGLPPSMS
ncbi:hypothetical protein RvY_14979 [Ramazzottius varieornatus]|uniref:Nuclear protein localization protein 4 homolog n=1 Tax=Ramazzottius varieornatus TaxID=947166 RepID=A0A1D1VT80_RAMVA|nr:hypothetical protein RvY_14979 [Ramazzottius varieornatus]